MKQLILSISITLFFTSCTSIKTYNNQITKLHSVKALHSDVNKVYKQLQRHHPHLYQFTSKKVLDFKFDSLKRNITQPMDSRMFYKQLAAVTKYIGQGHMSITPPRKRFTKKERKVLRGSKFDISNLDYEYLQGKLWVANARGKDTVLTGSEVLKINNETPQALIKKYKKLIASDGYNTTFHDRVVGHRFMSYYTKDKGRLDSISLTFKTPDSTFIKKYKRLLKTKTAKKTKIKKDSLSKLPKKTISKAEKKQNKAKKKALQEHRRKYGYIASRNEYTRNLNFIGKDSSIALLKIRGFSNGKYETFYAESFAKIDKRQSKALIIDLRNNFGGRLNEITHLYSYLTNKNFVMINPSEVNSRTPYLKLLMSNTTSLSTKLFTGLISPIILAQNLMRTSKKDGKLYYKFKSSKEMQPNLLHYRGPIYVLINGNSFSASSLLSTQLHANKRATLVGEETGGAYNGTVAGIYKIYQLPNTKLRARIGMMHLETPFKTSPDGYGVKPDVEILPTLQNRIDKVDPELEWVLKDIETKTKD